MNTSKWWKQTDEGVEFFDVDNFPTNSTLLMSHFRSSNIKEEITKVSQCWSEALNDQSKYIPAYSIETDDHENTQLLTTLKYFQFNGISAAEDSNNNEINISIVPTDNLQSDFNDIVTAGNSSSRNNLSTTFRPNVDNRNVSFFCPPSFDIDLSCCTTFNNMQTLGTSNIMQLPQTSTPIAKISKNKDKINIMQQNQCTITPKARKDNNNEIVSFSIKTAESNTSSSMKYSKSSMKLKLFGESELIKNFDIARKSVKHTSAEPSVSIYRTELAKVEVKLLNLECEMKKKNFGL